MSEPLVETFELEETPRPNFLRRTVAKIKNPKIVATVAAATAVTAVTIANTLRINELQLLLGSVLRGEVEAEGELLELEPPEDSEDI